MSWHNDLEAVAVVQAQAVAVDLVRGADKAAVDLVADGVAEGISCSE